MFSQFKKPEVSEIRHLKGSGQEASRDNKGIECHEEGLEENEKCNAKVEIYIKSRKNRLNPV